MSSWFSSFKDRLGFGSSDQPKATVCTSLACESLVSEVELRRDYLKKPHQFYHRFTRIINDGEREEHVTEVIAIQATKEASDITGVNLKCNRDSHVPPYYEVTGIIFDDTDHPIIP